MGCSDIARWLNQRTIETQGKLENTLVHGMRMVLMLMDRMVLMLNANMIDGDVDVLCYRFTQMEIMALV